MKIKHKLVAMLVAGILLLALGAAAAFWAFARLEETAELRRHTRELLNHADDLLSSVKDAETGERGYLLTGDATFLRHYLEVRGKLSPDLLELRKLTLISTAAKHLDALAPLLDAKLADMARNIELRRSQDMKVVLASVNSGQGTRLMDSIRTEMRAYVLIQESALKQRDAKFRSDLRRMFFIISFASVFTLLLSLLFAYLAFREVRNRLVNLETRHLLKLQQETNQQLAQANVTLQVSEEKLAVTLHSIGDGVIATDAEARVTLLNTEAQQLTGWTMAEALGRPIDEVFHIVNQETRKPTIIPVADALLHGTVQGLANHTVLIARDGSEHAIADSCAPIRNGDGRVVGAVLVFRDVTADYAAQQALSESELQYRELFEGSRDALMVLVPPLWHYTDVNQEAVRMFAAAQKSDFKGQSPAAFSPERQPDGSLSSEKSQELVATALREGNLIFEWEHRRLNGEPFISEVMLVRIEAGGLVWLQATVRDISLQRTAEAAMIKAGALQSAIFNSAHFSSIATDAKGVVQLFNVGAERMFGYTAAEVMNKFTPADFSDPQEVIARATALSVELGTLIAPGFDALVFKASRGIEDIYELTYVRKDGSHLSGVDSVTALRDAQNTIIGYLLIGADNTARKLAEEVLLKAGALQSAIFNSANFSSIATDANGVIQIFNVGAERMLGYTAAEVMNKITPADISDPQEVIARAKTLSTELGTPIAPGFDALVFKASRGIEDIYELTYVRKDGSHLPAVVSVTALRDAQNTIIGYLLIGTDNTARKEVEAEQRKLDQRLRDQQFYTRSLIESNIDALMTTDPKGIITDVNKQMEALTGCTRDELIGAPFKNYFTEPERAEAGVKQVLAEGKVTNYELTARSRVGTETVVSYNASTFYDRDRKLQGVFVAARDITERKHMDQIMQEQNVELESATAVAEKANLAKSEFLSSMSHELRSPLNAILGFAQLMESDSPSPTTSQKESIALILQAGWHLLKLINEILDLAKVESGQVPLSQEPVSLAEVMPECQRMVEPQAQQRGIKLTLPELNTPLFVRADRTRLKQILINLLSNAIKYNTAQGTIHVQCAQSTAGRTRVSITDTGAGLPPEKLAQLFQPFNRLGQEAGSEEGTGIGLVVAKRLVELMGGTIGVESTVGVGSTFWFELPAISKPTLADDDEHATAATQPHAKARRTSPHTLLYVEDNPANLKLVEKILLRHPDLRLLSAVNGTSGIATARGNKPDVILMDINLPDIDGFEALRILRADPITAHIPVIAISANAMPRDIERGLKSGFIRYLTKPIKVKEFMDALDVTLQMVENNALPADEALVVP